MSEKPTRKHIGLRVRMEYDPGGRLTIVAVGEVVSFHLSGAVVTFDEEEDVPAISMNGLLWRNRCRILEVLDPAHD